MNVFILSKNKKKKNQYNSHFQIKSNFKKDPVNYSTGHWNLEQNESTLL